MLYGYVVNNEHRLQVLFNNQPVLGKRRVQSLLEQLLSHKAHSNGHGRALMRQLKHGSPIYCPVTGGRLESSIIIEHCPVGGYWAYLNGDIEHLLCRLNADQLDALAKIQARVDAAGRRARRRKLPSPVVVHKRSTQYGENGRLRQHYAKSKITLAQGITAVARATRGSVDVLTAELCLDLYLGKPAVVRVSQYFSIVLTQLSPPRGSFLDLSTPVTVQSTKDNSHRAYRTLRRSLSRLLKGSTKRKDTQHARVLRMVA